MSWNTLLFIKEFQKYCQGMLIAYKTTYFQREVDRLADKDLVEIIKLCMSLDMTAYKTYLRISQAAANGGLKQFWTAMAAEEKEHAAYWNSALRLAEQDSIPQLFDEASRTRGDRAGSLGVVPAFGPRSRQSAGHLPAGLQDGVLHDP